MAEGLLFEEGRHILLVGNAFFHNGLPRALGRLDIFSTGIEYGDLWPEAHILRDRVSSALVFHLAYRLFVRGIVSGSSDSHTRRKGFGA